MKRLKGIIAGVIIGFVGVHVPMRLLESAFDLSGEQKFAVCLCYSNLFILLALIVLKHYPL